MERRYPKQKGRGYKNGAWAASSAVLCCVVLCCGVLCLGVYACMFIHNCSSDCEIGIKAWFVLIDDLVNSLTYWLCAHLHHPCLMIERTGCSSKFGYSAQTFSINNKNGGRRSWEAVCMSDRPNSRQSHSFQFSACLSSELKSNSNGTYKYPILPNDWVL